MKPCGCGAEEVTIAVGYRNDRTNVRPVRLHVEDEKSYANKPLFIIEQETKDYVKKHDGTRYGFNIAREIAGLRPGHQGMTAEEEIVVYLNANTLDLRRCNLRVQLASDERPARVSTAEEYEVPSTIKVHEHPQRRNSELELWNKQARGEA